MLNTPRIPSEVNRLAVKAEAYIHELFGEHLALEPMDVSGRLPFFLADKYAFLQGAVFGRPCVFMAVAASQLETPAATAKHWSQVRTALGGEVVVVLTDALSSHNRQRLIAHRVPFLAPGNQLFIPDLAMDLREHFRAEPKEAPARLTPAGQVTVLTAILGEPLAGATPSRLGRQFGYSPMSMGRVFDELQALELAEVRDVGRERLLNFHDRGRSLWERARPLLQSPVRKSRIIARPPEPLHAPIAGESALAQYTSLSFPRQETRAVPAREWKTLSRFFNLELRDSRDEDGLRIETWSYDPALLSHEPVVDRLSLYLSLEDRRDERLDRAAEALLEDMPW
ncbi:MAG: uncharacterized protein JWQ46_2757 [Phenylobacterium sp.]|nr:uncharacterized protein [Phenylobacterium sp.]